MKTRLNQYSTDENSAQPVQYWWKLGSASTVLMKTRLNQYSTDENSTQPILADFNRYHKLKHIF